MGIYCLTLTRGKATKYIEFDAESDADASANILDHAEEWVGEHPSVEIGWELSPEGSSEPVEGRVSVQITVTGPGSQTTKAAWKTMLLSKIGEYDDSELLLGGHALLSTLPFESPWISSYGACLIMVTDVRRENGVVQFQLADENCTPYENGSIWEPATAFYKEWPT